MSAETVHRSVSVTWSAQDHDRSRATGRALLFVLGDGTYGISVEFVRRVVELPSTVAVAGAESWLMGVANCEGAPLPLIDTQAILGQASAPNALKRAIIIDCAYGSVLLAVEQINTLSDLSGKKKHHSTPPEDASGFIDYSCEANGVTVGVLDMAKLFKYVSEPVSSVKSQQGESA